MSRSKTNKKETLLIKATPIQKNYEFEHIHEGIVCLCCGRVMISYYRHDYKTCDCPQRSMIDGGQDAYNRYGGMNMDLLRFVEVVPIFYDKNGKRSKKKLKTYREVQTTKRKQITPLK